ncbi:MAG: PTS sugar transporter subunit IIA [Treponema sp.]|jgi:nitrogen PTS system EIIA component|nr:PTS sugar transporter subunit IIA [Treponema sp.]
MLSSFITPQSIKIDLESTEKEECFAELLEVIVKKYPMIDRRCSLQALITREDKKSTAIFPHIAVPHAVTDSVNGMALAIGISKQGIPFDSVESEGKTEIVNIIFELFFEEKEMEVHLHALRDVLRIANNPNFISEALKATTSQEVYDLIVSLEY